ncbi:MAG: OsmC family protein [Bacteroidota bacterium]
MDQITEINGVKVTKMQEFKNLVMKDPTKGDHNPSLVAHWVGGSRSRVELKDKVVHIGGHGEFNSMQMLLATLAACDVDLMAIHASFLGLKIENLSVEATGHFNLQSYLGLEDAPPSAYDAISYVVRLSVPDATPEQIAYLRERCERSSPVRDSLARAIPLKLEFNANS